MGETHQSANAPARCPASPRLHDAREPYLCAEGIKETYPQLRTRRHGRRAAHHGAQLRGDRVVASINGYVERLEHAGERHPLRVRIGVDGISVGPGVLTSSKERLGFLSIAMWSRPPRHHRSCLKSSAQLTPRMAWRSASSSAAISSTSAIEEPGRLVGWGEPLAPVEGSYRRTERTVCEWSRSRTPVQFARRCLASSCLTTPALGRVVQSLPERARDRRARWFQRAHNVGLCK